MKRIAILVCASILACTPMAVCLVSGLTPALAEPQADHPKLDGKACADREKLALADTHESQAKLPDRQTDGFNPREALAHTDGVICPPPDLDPDINAPAPGGGRTPVIPPSAVEPGTQAK